MTLTILGAVINNPNDEEATETIPKNITQYNPADEIESIITPFDSIVESNFKQSGAVGEAIVITYKGEVAMIKCLGVRKEGENDSINANTIFRLASVSKSITGVLASILDDEKIVDLDDKIIDYLPNFQLKNSTYTQQLTIKNILSQSSGIVPHAYDLMVEDQWPLEKIIPYLKDATISAEPGKLYTYQNVVYSIYEPIIESKTNKDFNDVMAEKVFEPFGMKDASINFQSFKNTENKAYPHTQVSSTQFRTIPLNDRYYNTAPAAGVNASIADMGNLLIGLSGHHSEIFSAEANKTAFTPLVSSPLKRQYFSSWGKDVRNKSYAIGWRIVDYKNRKVAYHGGYVKGYKAEIAICNEVEIGIAILSNSPNSESSKCIPTFLNMIFDQQEEILAEKEATINAKKLNEIEDIITTSPLANALTPHKQQDKFQHF